MLRDAVDVETLFGADLMSKGVVGLSSDSMRQYLEYVADRRLERLGLVPEFGSTNPYAFLELQDVQELSNFFERKVSAYRTGVTGDVAFDEEF